MGIRYYKSPPADKSSNTDTGSGLSKSMDKITEPNDGVITYRRFQKDYRWHIKWVLISFLPVIVLFLFMPEVMLLPFFFWLAWSAISLVRMISYFATYSSNSLVNEEIVRIENDPVNYKQIITEEEILPEYDDVGESHKIDNHENIVEDTVTAQEVIENNMNKFDLYDVIEEIRSESETEKMPVPTGVDDPTYRDFYLNHERTGIAFFNEYVVIDIETTGFDYTEDLIVQIAAVKVKDGEIIEKFQGFNNKAYLSMYLEENSPITQEDIDSGVDIEELLRGFILFIDDNTLIGHNLGFDLSFLRTNMHRYELGDLTNSFTDTMLIGKYYANKDWRHHRVEDYIAHYKDQVGVLNLAQHSAENDVLYEQRIYEVERAILGDDFKADASLKMSWALPKVRVVETNAQRDVRFRNKMVKANRVAIDEKDYYYSNKLISELLSDGFTNYSRLYKRMAMNYKRLHKLDEVLLTIELWEANVGEKISNTDKEWIENQKLSKVKEK